MKDNMKKTATALFLVVTLLTGHTQANNIIMDVRASLPYIDFVKGENVPMTISLTNPGSTAFIIDDYPPYDQNSFSLFMRDARGRLALPYNKKSPLPECTIKPGETFSVTLNINNFFDLREEGHYQVSATVNRGADSASSRTLPFVMVSGIEIGKVRRVREGFDNSAFEYTLMYWARNEKEYLFFRITEVPSGRVYGFANLGTIVRIAQPKIEFESGTVVVVTHQTSRDNFVRTRLDMSGNALKILDSAPMTSTIAIQEAQATQRAHEKISEMEASESEKGGFLQRRTTRTPVVKKPE